MSKGSRNRQQQAREKIAQARAAEARRRRQRRWLAATGGAVVVAVAAVAITLVATSGGSPSSTASGGTPSLKLASLSTLGSLTPAPAAGSNGPEGVPIPGTAPLAGTATGATGQKVDGIGCSTREQTLFHIHAHLTIFVNGTPRQVPAGIGIPGATGQNSPQGQFVSNGKCFYWLHTHAPDGIIHIESPVQRTFTLGDFFDEWGQPLGPGTLGPLAGHVVAIYNGKVYLGNPRNIPLAAHAQIQLEIGTPLIAPQPITFPGL